MLWKNMAQILKKIKGWHIAVLAFIIFSAFILVNVESGTLTGDEVFYYFQAQNLKEGKLVWFEYTQPIFTPLVLALYPFTDPVILKILFSALLFSLSALVLYLLARKVVNQEVAVIASLIFILHRATINMSGWLYTEALFVLLLLLSFLLFYDIYRRDNEKWWKYIALGIVIGLAIQTRVIGFIIPLFFIVILLLEKWRKLFGKKVIASFVIAGLITLGYIFTNTLNFLSEKSGGLFLLSNLKSLYDIAPKYLTLPFIILFVISLFLKHKDEERFLLYFIVYYLLLLFLISNIFFPRYLYIIIPFASIFIAKLFFEKGIKYVAIVLFVVLIGYTIYSAPNLPGTLSQNYYVQAPEGCEEIKEFTYSCRGHGFEAKVSLPLFDMPVGADCNLRTDFELAENKSYIYIGYIDDYGTVFLDGSWKSIQTRDMWVPTILAQNLSKGNHSVSIDIHNGINIGGLGQVLLCDELGESKFLNISHFFYV